MMKKERSVLHTGVITRVVSIRACWQVIIPILLLLERIDNLADHTEDCLISTFSESIRLLVISGRGHMTNSVFDKEILSKVARDLGSLVGCNFDRYPIAVDNGFLEKS